MAVVSACATGAHAVGEAMETIKREDAGVMLAGGTDAVLAPVVVAGFINMRALGDDVTPQQASKPFDARRSGFILSEGAATLVLEEYERAKSRGAHIYAEVVGMGRPTTRSTWRHSLKRATAQRALCSERWTRPGSQPTR